MIAFTVVYCPLSSYITPKLNFKSLPQNRPSTLLSFVGGLNIFLSRVFFSACIFFSEQYTL